MRKTQSVEKIRRTKITRIILSILAVGGLMTMVAVAPNAIQALGLFAGNRKKFRSRVAYVNSAVNRLRRAGLVEFKKSEIGQTRVRLTLKGQKELERYFLGGRPLTKPKKWDGKYRVIIFDIKEWKRGIRDELRNTLRQLGFIRLQNSVWVYPYDCQDVVVLLKSHFKIGNEVLYLTVETIENDRWLRSEFNLSK